MKLSLLDVSIVVCYLISILLTGWFLRKKARQSKENYLMGGKTIPWYMLGLSNASDMFDISGTMWLVALCMVYGLKSIWIPWLWPVFNQVFNAVYLSKWLRRSNATTGAEWLASRFGSTGPGTKSSHAIIVIFAIISCLGFMAYGFIGLGKFIEVFVPWRLVQPYVPFNVPAQFVGHFYGIIFTLFAVFYTVIGGMHSIVLGDLIKYVLMVIGCIGIAIIARQQLESNPLPVPEGWKDPFFGWRLDLSWQGILPAADEKIAGDGFSLFGLFFMMMLFKGVLSSLAGFAPNYDMQKTLSARSPVDASKMAGFVSVVLFPVRYLMIAGVAVLGLLYFHHLPLTGGSGKIDFERVLPGVINSYLPAGLMGIVLTALLGAFMGTFSGTLNAAQAYIVNDIYLRYINPAAATRRMIHVNYFVGLMVVATGILIGFFAMDVNSILQWIVSGLWGGYTAANILKWYWWRFNAKGFYYGMAVGVFGALVMSRLFTGVEYLYWFPVLFLISLAGCLAGTFMAPPTDMHILVRFYRSVRPWGWWQPVKEQALEEDPSFKPNREFKRDMFNIVIGTVAQTCLTIVPMYLVLGMKKEFFTTAALLLVLGFILKKTWWNKLEN